MSRLKRLRVVDGLVDTLETIKKSQCSLSENDVELINEAIAELGRLRAKKGLTNKHFKQEAAHIVNLINKVLTSNS